MRTLARTLYGLAALLALAALPPVVERTSAPWVAPLGSPLIFTEPFRAPPNPYASGHRGIDLPATPGEVVLSPSDGVITFSGVVVDRPLVTVKIDEAILVTLEPVTAGEVGAEVTAGAQLGTVASAAESGGHCANTCVHLGVRVDGEYVNPLRFFAGRPKLLPW